MKAATSILLFSVLGLVVLGLVTLVSASTGQHETRYLTMQPVWAVLGLVACGVAAWVDYRYFKRFWWVLLLIAVVLLSLVWVPGVGISKNGAARWIGYGGWRLQPSELAKVALIIGLAWYGDRFQRHMGCLLRGLVVPSVAVGS